MTETTSAGEARIDADARARAGVYANHVEVVQREYEVTFDFVRLDPADLRNGVLVARVAMSHPAVMPFLDQMDALREQWRKETGRVRD